MTAINPIILNQIDQILDVCDNCQIKNDLTRGCKGNFSKIDRFCKTECELGERLRDLGGEAGEEEGTKQWMTQ